jgi:phytoene desaturase
VKESVARCLEEHFEVEKIITQLDWEVEYGVYRGATFNLSHKILQMMYFRQLNKFQRILGITF